MSKKPRRALDVLDVTPLQDLPAGEFSAWLRDTRSTLTSTSTASVPCGECTACCRSSYFIHIRPDETATLARIPKQLLFKAPGLPKGHVLMGYSDQGHCPMLIDNRCSIYEHRPQTCRDYDCRIFAATATPAGEDDKALVNARVRRWQFSYADNTARQEHRAVASASKFLREHVALFPAGALPKNATQLALLAVKTYEAFMNSGDAVQASATDDLSAEDQSDAATARQDADADIVSKMLAMRSDFDAALSDPKAGGS